MKVRRAGFVVVDGGRGSPLHCFAPIYVAHLLSAFVLHDCSPKYSDYVREDAFLHAFSCGLILRCFLKMTDLGKVQHG